MLPTWMTRTQCESPRSVGPFHNTTTLLATRGWFVFRGRMRIESDRGAVELTQGEGTVVGQGVRHRVTSLEEGTLVLVINRKGFEMIPDDAEELGASGFSEEDLV